MAEAGLLAGLELVVRLVLVLVQAVRSQGQQGWMRKIGVDHNSTGVQHVHSSIFFNSSKD